MVLCDQDLEQVLFDKYGIGWIVPKISLSNLL